MEKYLIERSNLMQISMSADEAKDFALYHQMLIAANKDMNLTRIGDDISEACDRNYLDSLTALKYLKDEGTLLDVGSGAGFPGLPIAIMLRNCRVTLMDSLSKRVDFLNSVIRSLGLNASSVHLRCEEAAKNEAYREQFDFVTARAVASMTVLSEWLLPFVKIGGRMIALKGPGAEEECEEAAFAIKTLGGRLKTIDDALIPGRDWAHKIVVIEKAEPTPQRFPRKAGIAEKRPLKA